MVISAGPKFVLLSRLGAANQSLRDVTRLRNGWSPALRNGLSLRLALMGPIPQSAGDAPVSLLRARYLRSAREAARGPAADLGRIWGSAYQLNRNCSSMRRFPAELPPPGPKKLASELDLPNNGELRLPMGVPKFS